MAGLGDVVKGTVQIAEAMGVTLKHLTKKPVTVEYPDEPIAVFPRYRGRHMLRKYDNGMERCIGCHSCSLACARLVHKCLSWENAGIRIQSSGGLSTGFTAKLCLVCDPAPCAAATAPG